MGEFRTLGLAVVAFSYDAPSVVQKFAAERKIEFPLLADADHSIVQRYGILNRQYEPGHRNYGIPHPGTFIVDRTGRVVARYFEEEYQYRNTSASIALKIGQPIAGMGAPVRQATAHLDLTAFVTDQTVAPGHRFSIVLDVAPKAGARIVAPGQHSYRVVALTLEANENVRRYPAAYPQGVEMAELSQDVRVGVYARPFRLVQDVAIVVNDEMRKVSKQPGGSVTLNGALEYQACTEKGCEPVQRVPLSWTLSLKPLG
jgi:hypothetical protein